METSPALQSLEARASLQQASILWEGRVFQGLSFLSLTSDPRPFDRAKTRDQGAWEALAKTHLR